VLGSNACSAMPTLYSSLQANTTKVDLALILSYLNDRDIKVMFTRLESRRTFGRSF